MTLRQPIDKNQLTTDLSEMIFDLPLACVYKGIAFSASASDRSRTVDFQDHGVQNSDNLELVVPLSVLTGSIVFEAEQDITAGGDNYIIDSVNKNQDGISVTLQLRTRYDS